MSRALCYNFSNENRHKNKKSSLSADVNRDNIMGLWYLRFAMDYKDLPEHAQAFGHDDPRPLLKVLK
jgi:hypothetical protein